jgi:hypothetical protein
VKEVLFAAKINKLFDLFNQDRPDNALIKTWWRLFGERWTEEQMDGAMGKVLESKARLQRGENVAHVLKQGFLAWRGADQGRQARDETCPHCDGGLGAIFTWRFKDGQYLRATSLCRFCHPRDRRSTTRDALRDAGFIVCEPGEDWREKCLLMDSYNAQASIKNVPGQGHGETPQGFSAPGLRAGFPGVPGGNFEVPRNEVNHERRTTSDRQIPLVTG